MHVTKAQIETLLVKFPTDEHDGWEVDLEDWVTGHLSVKLGGPLLEDSYLRFVTKDGAILRWDEDENRWLPATAAPEEGSYRTTRDDKTHVFHY